MLKNDNNYNRCYALMNKENFDKEACINALRNIEVDDLNNLREVVLHNDTLFKSPSYRAHNGKQGVVKDITLISEDDVIEDYNDYGVSLNYFIVPIWVKKWLVVSPEDIINGVKNLGYSELNSLMHDLGIWANETEVAYFESIEIGRRLGWAFCGSYSISMEINKSDNSVMFEYDKKSKIFYVRGFNENDIATVINIDKVVYELQQVKNKEYLSNVLK